MPSGYAAMFLTFAIAITYANGEMYWRSTTFGGANCASMTDDFIMSLKAMEPYLGYPLDTCSMNKEAPGSYIILDSSTCGFQGYLDSNCQNAAGNTHSGMYAAQACENSVGKSEKNGCVSSKPAGVKDLSCLNSNEIASIETSGKHVCVQDCTMDPTTVAEFDAMSTGNGCASDCPESVLSIMRKYVGGCVGIASSSLRGAHAQYAFLFTVLAIYLGFFLF